MPAPYYDDDEQVTEACEFPYAEVDAHLASEAIEDADYIDPGDLGKARVFYKLLEWVWQRIPRNRSGFEIRATILCWVFMRELQPVSLTLLAANTHHKCHNCKKPIAICPECGAQLDRAKQSLGRWVKSFKHTFPNIKTQNMQVEETERKNETRNQPNRSARTARNSKVHKRARTNNRTA